MPIAKDKKEFTNAPEGTHLARCIGVYSLGYQPAEREFAAAYKVMLDFELPHELTDTDKGQQPLTIQKEYTLSLNKKSNLRRDVAGWRGRDFTEEELAGFDVAKVLGAPCMLTVAHTTNANSGKVSAKIMSISALIKNMPMPGAVHPPRLFEVEHGRNPVFLALPEWIRKKIELCEEWQTGNRGGTAAGQPAPAPRPAPQASPVYGAMGKPHQPESHQQPQLAPVLPPAIGPATGPVTEMTAADDDVPF